MAGNSRYKTMNTNEPKIELPEPPEGHRWEYRGMGWNPGKVIPTYCHTTRYSDLVMTQNELPSGVGDYHYWEAVPDSFHGDAARAVTENASGKIIITPKP
jgi:hypothetical protein